MFGLKTMSLVKRKLELEAKKKELEEKLEHIGEFEGYDFKVPDVVLPTAEDIMAGKVAVSGIEIPNVADALPDIDKEFKDLDKTLEELAKVDRELKKVYKALEDRERE